MARLLPLLPLASCLVTLTLALTDRELALIADYARRTPNVAGCSRLVVQNSGLFSRLNSRGMPNHAVYQTSQAALVGNKSYDSHIFSTPQIQPGVMYCLPTDSPIGYAINGLPLYSPLSSSFRNTVQGSTALLQDGCHGRVSSRGYYHYPTPPALDCLYTDPRPTGEVLLGVALDGAPIYYPAQGVEVEPGLDECGGKNTSSGYRYYVSPTRFPYFMSCFRGHVGVFYNSPGVEPTMCQGLQMNGLCSCHVIQRQAVPPPAVSPLGGRAGSAPGTSGSRGGQPRPPAPPPPMITIALNYYMQNVSDGNARMPYTCQVELNRERWCNPNAARPADCGQVQEPEARPSPAPAPAPAPVDPSQRPEVYPIPDRGRPVGPDYGPSDPRGGPPRRPGDYRPDNPFPRPPGGGPTGQLFDGRRVSGPSGAELDERNRCQCDCSQCGRGVRFTPGRSVNNTRNIPAPPPPPYRPSPAIAPSPAPAPTNTPILADGRRNPDGSYSPARGPPRRPGDNRPETPFPLPPSSGPVAAPASPGMRPRAPSPAVDSNPTRSPSTNTPIIADRRQNPDGSYGPSGGRPSRPGGNRPGPPAPSPAPGPSGGSGLRPPGSPENIINTVEREGECLCDCNRCMLGLVYQPGNNNVYNNMAPPPPAPYRPGMPGAPSTASPTETGRGSQMRGMHMMNKPPAPRLLTVKPPQPPAPFSGGEPQDEDDNRIPKAPGQDGDKS